MLQANWDINLEQITTSDEQPLNRKTTQEKVTPYLKIEQANRILALFNKGIPLPVSVCYLYGKLTFCSNNSTIKIEYNNESIFLSIDQSLLLLHESIKDNTNVLACCKLIETNTYSWQATSLILTEFSNYDKLHELRCSLCKTKIPEL